MTKSQSVVPQGLVPPLVTPLQGPDRLDEAGLERLLEHVVGGGVQGLFLLGTTGEGPSLSYRLRRELVERTCRHVNGRVPVLVCITDTSPVESLRVAGWAADAGAVAVVSAPPYYYSPNQTELQRYFDDLATASPLPLLLYNMPSMTKISIELATVQHAMEHPQIIGIKDSSADLGYLAGVLASRVRRPDWRVFVGDEETLGHAVQLGADGGVNGGANVFPKLHVGFFKAAASRDVVRAEKFHASVVRLGQLYGVGSKHSASGIKGIKCALSLLGICSGDTAPPLQPFAGPERNRVQEIVRQMTAEVDSLTSD